MTRVLLALALLSPGSSYAQVRAVAPVSAPVGGQAASAPRIALPPATLPSLGAPSLPVLPAAAVPVLAPALSAARPAAANAERPGDAPKPAKAPKTALEGLKTELPGKAPEASDLNGSRDHAERAFMAKLGAEDFDPASVDGFTPFGAVEVPPSGASSDDGGGPDHPRGEVRLNGTVLPTVAFRPNDPVEAHIVAAIDASRESVKIALYEFTSRNILKALQAAKRRGVKVQIVLDYHAAFPKNEPGADYRRRRSEQIWALVRDGFDLRVLRTGTEFGINHNKFAVFDGQVAEYGSYNWSYTAERNHYENALFTDEAARVKALTDYWQYQWDMAVPEKDAKTHPWPSKVPAPPAEASPSVDFNGTKLPSYLFTPGDKFEDAVVAAIDAARVSVDYAMFSLRSTKVVEALDRARARGLKVRALIDQSQSESEYFKPFSDWLAQRGIEVAILAGPNPDSDFPMAEKMHNKSMILDGKLVETGSANHTKRASVDNYENAHFLTDPTTVAAFQFAYDHMFAIARRLQAPAEPVTLPTDEQLLEDILNPPPPKPVPPPPPEVPLPAARTLKHNGATIPTTAFPTYEDGERHIVAAIDSAKKTVKIAIYQFEMPGVLEALQRAKKRKIKVQVVLDRAHVYTTGKSHTGGPRKPRPLVVELVKSGFDLVLLKGQSSGIQHNKFLIVDDALLQTGSYNYTTQSETDHFENILFTKDKARVDLYERYWDYMRAHAEEVDFDKLEEILNRGLEAEDADLDPEAAAEGGRKSKFPPPPEDAETPVKLHGESFPRAMFSPQGGIEDALVRAVGAARETIDIAMFSFYSQRLAEALLEAKERGVKIRIALDRSQSALAKLDDWFAWHGFEVKLVSGPDDERDPLYQKMHNKFMLIDGVWLETGSFNYSPNAEKNSFENANFHDEADIVERFTAFFERVWRAGFKARPPKREPQFRAPASET